MLFGKKKSAESVFAKHYKSMLKITNGSSIPKNADFELLPAMFIICDYAAASSGKDRRTIANTIMNEVKKARELNKVKPNPVFGLMLTSRDLGKYEECISWCDIYKTLSNDGRDAATRNEANKKLGRPTNPQKTDRF